MPVWANVAGVWKQCVVWQNVAGVWKQVQLKQNVAGVWKTISGSAFAATASPASVSGSGSTTAITSNSSTATPTGGVGPYTYSWVEVGGPSGITILSPTAATTSFRKTMASGEVAFGTFRCNVTDTSNSAVTSTNNVNVDLTRT